MLVANFLANMFAAQFTAVVGPFPAAKYIVQSVSSGLFFYIVIVGSAACFFAVAAQYSRLAVDVKL